MYNSPWDLLKDLQNANQFLADENEKIKKANSYLLGTDDVITIEDEVYMDLKIAPPEELLSYRDMKSNETKYN